MVVVVTMALDVVMTCNGYGGDGVESFFSGDGGGSHDWLRW